MIGIIGAMQVEVKTLTAMLDNKTEEIISGIKFVKGELHGKEIVVACCGVGKVFAAIAAEAMILRFAPEIVINSGVGGAVSEKLKIADIVISDSVVQYDMDTTAFGDPRGMISGINIVNIPSSKKAAALFAECADSLGITYYIGRIASGDKFVSSSEEKLAIGKDFNALACEMEGASIGHVCYVNNTDFVVLRSVSDSLTDESVMEFEKFTELATTNSVKMLDMFIKKYN